MKKESIEISQDRLEILEEIEKLEREGRFDVDPEKDPPTIVLTPDNVDYLNTKSSSKIKSIVANKLAENEEATQNELELCLNSLFDKTVYSGATINNNDDNFVKFNGCKSLLWATSNNLFARLASNGKVFKLV